MLVKPMTEARLNMIAALEATVHRVLELLAEDLAELALSPAEVNALFHLGGDDGPVTVAALLVATGQRGSTLTGVISRLEERGLVARAINPDDRRSFLLSLTDDGAAAAAEVRAAFVRREAMTLERLPRQAADDFLRVLHALDRVARDGR